MKAALLMAPGKVVVDEVPDPELGHGDVEIRVERVGLCGSDVSVFSGKWQAPAYPWIMGHEAFGVVTAVGEGVPADRVGEMVVVEPNIACMTCRPCLSGLTSACQNRVSVGMNRPGALAEKVVVPSEYAWPARDIAPVDLICVEPLTVVEAALRRLARPVPSDVLIVGAGPQGLLMLVTLLARGSRVHVLDVNEARLAFAGSLGASTGEPDTDFELVVDTVGSPEANQSAVGHSRPGATILVLGLDDRPLGLDSRTLVRRQLELRGSLTYDHPIDFRHTLDVLARGELKPGQVIAHEYALDDVQRAFTESPQAPGKTWISIGGSERRPIAVSDVHSLDKKR